MIQVYESHLGGIYFSTIVYDDEFLYCEQCGDSDWHLGEAETWQDVLDMITDDDGFCCWSEDYLKEVKKEFEARVNQYGENK